MGTTILITTAAVAAGVTAYKLSEYLYEGSDWQHMAVQYGAVLAVAVVAGVIIHSI